ncbi:hypothetical protein [Pseudomonas anguilliseptica]|uniref:Uncharacterized protein n=1 Tax=Pseudomonas anguilliseptica TaxID=53406 RepID=A0A1H5A7C0_PSEAG|nr:hypothetical protein [Pseudomonas anguilliseptica]SED37828.1 hypothetical protein SAMN05421553_2550 [Pseudomonas anguilliseptica]
MAKQKPSYHPQHPGTFTAPTTTQPGFIEGTEATAGFGHRDFYIAVIPRAEAVSIIRANHYSRRIVSNSFIHLGVWVDGVMRGVLQFGYALNPRAADKIVAGTEIGQYLELNRMWLDDIAPRNSESRALSYCFKYIKRVCPAVAWIQSFADERCGAWGVVYQAANFHYFGHHWTSFYELDGETYHSQLLSRHKASGGRAQYLRENLGRATIHRLRQFRYIYMVKQSWLKRCKVSPLPYPKPGQPLPDRRRHRRLVQVPNTAQNLPTRRTPRGAK